MRYLLQKPKMGFLFIMVLTISSLQKTSAQICQCDYTLENDSNLLINVFDSKDFKYSPGNVFCLNAGKWSGIRFFGFKGAPGKPIIFKNHNGEVMVNGKISEGIKFIDCENIKLTGNGFEKDSFGIKIIPLDIDYDAIKLENTDGIELSHLELQGGKKTGLNITLSPPFNRKNKYEAKIHHNKIKGFQNHGIHLTTSNTRFSKNRARVRITHNYIENSGKTDIFADLPGSACELNNNFLNHSLAGNLSCETGMHISNANHLKIHSNKLKSIPGATLYQGFYAENIASKIEMYNNLLVYPGNKGIYINQEGINPKNESTFYFINNTIISPKETGMVFKVCEHAADPKDCLHDFDYGFYNNLIIQTNQQKMNPANFIQMTGSHQDSVLKESNNYFANSFEGLGIKDSLHANYGLTETSPLVNAGKNIDQYNITTDIEGIPRPQEGQYDIGCFEYKASLFSKTKTAKITKVMAFPNSEKDKLFLINNATGSQKVEVGIYNCFNQKMKELKLGPNLNEINMLSYKAGVYFIVIKMDDALQTLRFVKC